MAEDGEFCSIKDRVSAIAEAGIDSWPVQTKTFVILGKLINKEYFLIELCVRLKRFERWKISLRIGGPKNRMLSKINQVGRVTCFSFVTKHICCLP